MGKQYLFLIVTMITVSSCTHKAVFREVTENNRYVISIPDYLKPCTNLSKDAASQYQNTGIGIYSLVIMEKKKTMQAL